VQSSSNICKISVTVKTVIQDAMISVRSTVSHVEAADRSYSSGLNLTGGLTYRRGRIS